MGSHRQRLLHKLATLGALLGGETRIDSDDLTTSTSSLVSQNIQKRAPSGVQNAFCQGTACQSPNVQVFHHDGTIPIRVPFGRLKVKIAALALDLQMGFRHFPRHLLATVTALHASTQSPLLAAQGCLTLSI